MSRGKSSGDHGAEMRGQQFTESRLKFLVVVFVELIPSTSLRMTVMVSGRMRVILSDQGDATGSNTKYL